jgi:hypothetical protein
MSFSLARCKGCGKPLSALAAQHSIQRLTTLADRLRRPVKELIDQHYPLCLDCLKKLEEQTS